MIVVIMHKIVYLQPAPLCTDNHISNSRRTFLNGCLYIQLS